jgi:hypothetical protein
MLLMGRQREPTILPVFCHSLFLRFEAAYNLLKVQYFHRYIRLYQLKNLWKRLKICEFLIKSVECGLGGSIAAPGIFCNIWEGGAINWAGIIREGQFPRVGIAY